MSSPDGEERLPAPHQPKCPTEGEVNTSMSGPRHRARHTTDRNPPPGPTRTGRPGRTLHRRLAITMTAALTGVLALGITYVGARPNHLAATTILRSDELSLWGSTATPRSAADPDTRSVELGTRFSTDTPGTVNAVMFYKHPQNGGPHTGALWSGTGTLLATVQFGTETVSGWQIARLATPVHLAANTPYVVSYHAPHGRYADDTDYFAGTQQVRRAGPLTATAGVYAYGDPARFPAAVWRSSTYYVDVAFRADSGAAPTGTPPPTSAPPPTMKPPVTTAPVTSPPPTTTATPAPPPVGGGTVVGSGPSATTFPERPGLTGAESGLTQYTGPAQLTSGTYLIENKLVTKQIELPRGSTATLTLRNVKFRAAATYQVIARGGTVHADHVFVDGALNSNEPAVVIEGGGWIRYSELVNVANPIRLGSNSRAEWNYLHSFPTSTAEGGAHSDGIEIYYGARENGAPATGPHIFALHNYIDMGKAEGANSSINVTNDFGPVDGVRIEGNTLLPGGNYALYLRSDGYCGCGGNNRDIEVVNNRWFADAANRWGGYYGTHSYQPAVGVTVWSGNTLTRTSGQVVGITLGNGQP
jgi:hypothetical protein